MKQRGVAIRGLVPLVLCASAAARMPLAGRAAFANHAMLRSCSGRGSTLFPSKGTNGKRLWGRRLPHGRRDVDSGGAALGFSSSAAAAAGVELPDDELDVLVKTTVAALPTRPRVAVVGGVYLNPNTRRGASDQTCSNASTARETAVRKKRDSRVAAACDGVYHPPPPPAPVLERFQIFESPHDCHHPWPLVPYI